MTTQYVIFQNADKTEIGMTTRVNWDKPQPGTWPARLKLDDSGQLMQVVHEFTATSWDEAREIYNRWNGYA